MNPGELNCRITLERLVKLEDDSGGYLETYTPYATLWAKLVPIKMSQKDIAEQIISGAIYEITIRYRPDYQTNDRVAYKGRSFQQIAPAFNIEEKNVYLQLTAEEVVENE